LIYCMRDSPLKKIYLELEKLKLDCLLVSSAANISYLTQTRSRDAYLIVSKSKNIYITDFRYIEETKKNLTGFCIKKIESSVFKTIADTCKGMQFYRVGFEDRYLAFAEYTKIKEEMDYCVELIPTHNIVEDLRQLKTQEELEKIKFAAIIAIQAFNFIKDSISPGKKEVEIAADLERFMRYNGAYSSSFDIIVASGPNSSFPHHVTSERKIRNNEPVLIDLGVDYLGYKSDLTRVFFLGKISSSCKRIYNIVLQAQKRAIKAIKPAVNINKIDAAARQFIASQGFGGFFGHNLGHGIGLEVHEAPHVSSKETNKLLPGMVFTVEPAIYLPGKFGIRIEDMCLITKKGVEVISGSLNK